MTRSLVQTLHDLFISLTRRRRMQLAMLLGLMLAGAMAEVVSIGAIIPFLAVLVNPSQALQMPLVSGVVHTLGLSVNSDLRWYVTLLFAITIVVSGTVRFLLIYITAKFNFGIGHEIGTEVYRRVLYQPYEVHVARNSSEIIGGIKKVDEVVWILLGLLNMISASLMAAFIMIALVLIDPVLAIVSLLGLGSVYVIVFVIVRKRLSINSQVSSQAVNKRVQEVQEGLGGIRDVLLDHAQILFIRRFNKTDWSLRQAQASNNIIGPSPRFAVEALGMILIALIAYTMSSSSGGIAVAIPVIGVLTLGAQRLMPLIQQTYQCWVLVSGNRQVLHDVVDLLKQMVAEESPVQLGRLPFEREIRFNQVSFRYQPHLPLVLHHLTVTIPKGSRVGFVGITGSGKSTVMDLLMGLLQPTDGQIIVDDMPLVGTTRLAWQSNIAHVPQAIYLADASFAENIAFGVAVEQIDFARVKQAAIQAQIADFIEVNPQGFQTMVGERGVRLSGGQRQRIGIARALYKQATVLVFDEATNALDRETEFAVMQAIEKLGRNITVLMISHRFETMHSCDVVYRLENGCIVESDHDLCSNRPST